MSFLDGNFVAAPVAIAGAEPWPASQHIVIIGDSNAEGQSDTDKMLDRTLLSTFSPVTNSYTMGGSGYPPTYTYQVANTALAPYKAGGGGQNAGIELTLGRELYNRYGYSAPKISKWAMYGSSMCLEWLPANGEDVIPLLAYLDTQVALNGPIGAVIQSNGSNDAVSWANANVWQQSCASLMAVLRARYGNFGLVIWQVSIDPPSGDGVPYREAVRQQQVAYVNSDPLAVLMNIDDIPLTASNVHFVADEYNLIGQRAAQVITARRGVSPAPYAGAFPEYVGAGIGRLGATSGTLTPIPYPAPSGPGYFEILVTATGLTASAGAPTLAEPAGFTQIGTGGEGIYASTSQQWLTCWYRRVTSQRMSAPTMTINNAWCMTRIFTFRQPTTIAGSPLDVTQVFSSNNTYSTAAISITGLTTVTANDLIAYFMASWSGSPNAMTSPTNAALGSLAVIQDNCLPGVASDYPGITLVTGTKAVAGAIGTTTITPSTNTLSACVALAIKP